MISDLIIQPSLPRLPQPVVLGNGVELNLIPITSNDLVYVTVMFVGGQWVQSVRLQSDFTVRQLRSGTAAMSPDEVDEAFDFYGSTVTVGSTGTFSYVQLTSLRSTLPYVLPLFAEILARPAFSQAQLDLAIEEGIMTNNIATQRLSEACKRLFVKNLLGEQHPMSQFPEAVDYQNITRQDLIAYHSRYLHAANAIVYITGNADDSVVAMIDREFSAALPSRSGDAQKAVFHVAKPVADRPLFVEKTGTGAQAAIRIGKILPHITHPDYPAIMFAATALGGYFGSRLMANIRERLGLTYGIGAHIATMPHDSYLVIATETAHSETSRCVDETMRDIRALQTTPMTTDEMTLVKNYQLGQFCRATEASYTLVSTIMTFRAIGYSLHDMLECQQRLAALTPADIQRAVHTYLNPDTMLVATFTPSE